MRCWEMGGRTIAVVGLSENPGKPSHYVSEYMQQHGYKIYPVNPSLERCWARKAMRRWRNCR